MLSYHSDEKIKSKYVGRVEAHIKADNLIRGNGWDGTKGCAVGCTLENYDHARYPIELGIPEWLARVEDTLFEGMSLEKSRTWPKDFLEAISVGVDLEKAKTPFIVVVLKSTIESMNACVYDEKKNPDVKKAIDDSIKAVEMMIHAHENGLDLSAAVSAARSAARSARSAARSAARAAESAARSAVSAWSAVSAVSAARSAVSVARSAASAAWSAASAAVSAAESAESVARSAASAAWSAAESAESAARSAASVWSAASDYFADELLSILRGIK